MFYRWEDLKSKIKSLRSLKTRIFILIFLVGLIPGYCMQYGILQNYEIRAISVRSSEVQAQLKILANHLITYNYLQDTSSPVINAELEQLSNLYGGSVQISRNNQNTPAVQIGKLL